MEDHRARVLAMIRQIEEMELTPKEIRSLNERHYGRMTTASMVIYEATNQILHRK